MHLCDAQRLTRNAGGDEPNGSRLGVLAGHGPVKLDPVCAVFVAALEEPQVPLAGVALTLGEMRVMNRRISGSVPDTGSHPTTRVRRTTVGTRTGWRVEKGPTPSRRRTSGQDWHCGQRYAFRPEILTASIGVRHRRHGFPARP